MKLMYYLGYAELGTNRSIAHKPLEVGKKYLVESYSTWVERNGNGGSTYSSSETYMKVFDPKTKKELIKGEWPSVFRENKIKNCKHEDSGFIDAQKIKRICRGCFKKIVIKTVIKEI